MWLEELLNEVEGISCVKPKGALYLFPKIDTARFNIADDERFILDFLLAEKVLMVKALASTGQHQITFAWCSYPTQSNCTNPSAD